jgi:putative Ca2+/H+ antiporter (TMEM165/GDT1 family)
MEAFLTSFSMVAIAEMGDRTQLLSMVFAARFGKPIPILAGVLVATLLNHFLAGLAGNIFATFFTPAVLTTIGATSLLVMAAWMLKADAAPEDAAPDGHANVFLATLVAFFVAEIGDKTQIATLTLGAMYPNLAAVVAGTTAGMMAANIPAVYMGHALSTRLPLKTLNRAAAVLFAVIGLVFATRAVRLWTGG